MRPSSLRTSTQPQDRVNLYCKECKSQIGIFENEWIRLTASYARPKDKGVHFGTEVGVRTQIVPSGVAQKAAEGCVMSDVFCRKCSTSVGQFCRSAPGVDQQYLVDQYFYKLSRVFMRDCQTKQRVDPEFGFGDAHQQVVRSSAAPSQRWSQTPLAKNTRYTRPKSVTKPPTQPHDEAAEPVSPEPPRLGSRRESEDRHSLQSSGHDAENMAPPRESVTHRHIQTPIRSSMPPEWYPSNGIAQQHFTPQPTFPQPMYVQPYMTPMMPGSLRADSVPPQPTYSQPMYAQSPFPPQVIYHAYPQPQPQPQAYSIQPGSPVPSQAEDQANTAPEKALQAVEQEATGQTGDTETGALTTISQHSLKMNEQAAQIAGLGKKLNELLKEVQKINICLTEMRSDMGLQPNGNDSSTNLLMNFETIGQAIRAVHSQQTEMKALRDENESLKTRLETTASAMNTAQSQITTPNGLTQLNRQAATPSSLGKRKRDNKRSPLLQSEIATDEPRFDDNVGQVYQTRSSKRRNGGDAVPQNLSVPENFGAPTPTSLSCRDSAQSSIDLSDVVSAAGDSEEDHTRNEDSLFFVSTKDQVMTDSQVIESQVPGTTFETEREEDNSQVEISGSPELREESPLVAQPTARDADSPLCAGEDSTFANSIDFSDDEPVEQDKALQIQDSGMTESTMTSNELASEHELAAQETQISREQESAPLVEGSVTQSVVQSERPPTSRSDASEPTNLSVGDDTPDLGNVIAEELASTRKTGRRVTDSVVNLRTSTQTPEPPKSKRPTARRSDGSRLIDLDSAFVATQTMMAEKIKNKGRPKVPKVPKPKVQTTEKQLNNELIQLGLSQWIGKDKSLPEYKQAVDAARLRAREANRIQKLSEKGLNVARNEGVWRQAVTPSTPSQDKPASDIQTSRSGSSQHNVQQKAAQDQATPELASQRKDFQVNGVGSNVRQPVAERPSPNVQRAAAASGKPRTQERAAAAAAAAASKSELSSTPVRETRGMQTRRQQYAQADMIKQRDRMAQEAMEQEEMENARFVPLGMNSEFVEKRVRAMLWRNFSRGSPKDPNYINPIASRSTTKSDLIVSSDRITHVPGIRLISSRPDGDSQAQPSQSELEKIQIVPAEVYLNQTRYLAACVPSGALSKAERQITFARVRQSLDALTPNMEEAPMQPTQEATQPLQDPRRLGKNVSDVSEGDLSDVICILHPNSPAAFEAVRATMLVGPQHILQNDDLEGITEADLGHHTLYNKPRELALRMSSNVRHPTSGFSFGRNPKFADILLVKDTGEKNVSNTHFKIFVNNQGSLMLQDTSINGTLVDDDHLRGKDRNGRLISKPATIALRNGSLICVVGTDKAEIKLIVRIPSRGDHEDIYEENLKSYLAARGKVAQFASMRESSFGNYWNGGAVYNFTGYLGKGAFATVYRVQTKKEGKLLAAKELDKRRFIKNGVLDLKFDSELKIMQQLRHPNIVEYIDCHIHEHWIYILMEFIPYGDLSKELEKYGPIAEPVVQSITRQILHALDYLHRRNITHRDIKPDNILIASRGPLIVKLSDFGLSKCVKNQETFLKTFCGTLLYCAPEIYPDYSKYQSGIQPKRRRLGEPAPRTSPYDQSVDMWSFGAVLFHILCGRAPIMGRGEDKGAQMLNSIMTEDVDFAPLRQRGVSDYAIDFIAKLMNRNPFYRPKEAECFKHGWLRDVEDIFEYVQEKEIPIQFQRNLGVVNEEEEFDDEEEAVYQAVRDLEEVTNISQTSEPREFKKPRLQGPNEGDVAQHPETALYPNLLRLEDSATLPVLDSIPLPAPLNAPPTTQRLFGEITASALRSSGVLGEPALNHGEVRDMENRVQNISVNDFVSRYDSDMPRTHNPGSAASLFGAEAQIGQLNMASPENATSENVATPDTTNPVTPQTRQMSPSGVLTQSEEEEIASQSSYKNDLSPVKGFDQPPEFTREINLALLADNAAFSRSIKARDESRALKLQEKAATFHVHPGLNGSGGGQGDSIDLARTIDFRTGNAAVDERAPGIPELNADHQTPPATDVARKEVTEEESHLARLTTIPGSTDKLEINIDSRLTSWGRGLDCTVIYGKKNEIRVPKYAVKLTFWAPGVEKLIAEGGDWMKMPGIHTIIATSASRCIWVNGVELRRETVDGAAALYGKVYSGDIITVFEQKGEFLKFQLDIFFGDSARPRPESERSFQLQEERRHHQRMMKERESMRLTQSDLSQIRPDARALSAS